MGHLERPATDGSENHGEAWLLPIHTLQALAILAKTLVFSTDDTPELDRDMEGMVVLSPHELLLVNDNDFSVEGARTRFWRIRLKNALF